MSQYEIKVRETITKIARVRAKSPDLAASALQEWLADNGDVSELDSANEGPSTVLSDPAPSDAALWPAHVPDDEVYEDDGAPILPPRSERPEFWAQIGDHWWATNGHVAVREGEPACYGKQGYIIWSKEAPDAPTKLADWIARPSRVLHFAETSPQYYDRMGPDDGATSRAPTATAARSSHSIVDSGRRGHSAIGAARVRSIRVSHAGMASPSPSSCRCGAIGRRA